MEKQKATSDELNISKNQKRQNSIKVTKLDGADNARPRMQKKGASRASSAAASQKGSPNTSRKKAIVYSTLDNQQTKIPNLAHK